MLPTAELQSHLEHISHRPGIQEQLPCIIMSYYMLSHYNFINYMYNKSWIDYMTLP